MSPAGNSNTMWKTINEILNRKKNKTTSPKHIVPNDGTDTILTNRIDIAEKFNEFFTNIGPALASQITSSTDFSSYISR